MTTQEFSAQWDVLWNNVASNQAPGFNEYEKSVFLTKAQNMLVKEFFNRRTDGIGGGYDGSELRQYDFSSLIRVENLFYANTFKERISATEKLDRRSLPYYFPVNYFLTVNEILYDKKYQYSVSPLEYGEYQRLMLKPYNFPVKRGAWRLITDKKNCNYCHESHEQDEQGKYIALADNDNSAVADYKIMTGWSDQKRNIEVTFIASDSDIDTDSIRRKVGSDEATISNYTWTDDEETQYLLTFKTAKKWDSTNKTYRIAIGVQPWEKEGIIPEHKLKDDEGVIEALKSYFAEGNLSDEELKISQHLDGLKMCSAPSKFDTFFNSEGRTFTTHVIKVPVAEIIGKFAEVPPTYQLRFVRNLTPIILDDLDTSYSDDVTLMGMSKRTECELPEECHQEILERAVTLAKLAWQGGTATQAASQRKED